MGLQKKIYHPESNKKPTKEDIKRRELAWDILCKNGSVCITNPLHDEKESDFDQYGTTGPFCDYHDCNGENPLEEYNK